MCFGGSLGHSPIDLDESCQELVGDSRAEPICRRAETPRELFQFPVSTGPEPRFGFALAPTPRPEASAWAVPGGIPQ